MRWLSRRARKRSPRFNPAGEKQQEPGNENDKARQPEHQGGPHSIVEETAKETTAGTTEAEHHAPEDTLGGSSHTGRGDLAGIGDTGDPEQAKSGSM